MKLFLFAFLASVLCCNANAQYNTLYQHYFTPISGQELTVIDEDNTQFDSQGNIYTMLDRESIRYAILTCLKTNGSVGWIDTLKLNPYLQSAVGHLRLSTNRIYTLSTYGNNLNSSIAEAIAITKYDLNGTQLNQVVLSNTGTNFRSQEIYAQPNGHLLITYLTNTSMTNWTVHVDCYDSLLNQVWVNSFPWPVYSPSTIPLTSDNSSNCYLTYTTDSIDASNYYRKAFVHKIDANGNLVWTKNVLDKRYKYCKIDQSGNLIMAGETIAPLVYINNNVGDALVTKWSSSGTQLWETIYNAASGEKEIVNSLDVDANNTIFIGGNQDLQDATAAHYRGFANLYSSTGSLVKNIVRPSLDVVYATRFLNSGNPIIRSATGTMLTLNRYNISGTALDSNQYTFGNGASWTSMDILANDDIALSVSDQLCADRGVTVFRLSEQGATSLSNSFEENNIVSMYPNPTKDVIHIESNEAIQSATCYDILGAKHTLNQLNSTNFATHQLANGIYIIDVQTTGHRWKASLLKQ